MKRHIIMIVGLLLTSVLGGDRVFAQACVNAAGKSCPQGAVLLDGPAVFPSPMLQTQKSCSLVGMWRSAAGTRIVVNNNLSGTFAAPYCPSAHTLSAKPQGTNKFQIRITWNGARGVCQSSTLTVEFTSTDCNVAQGRYVNDDNTSGTEIWTRTVSSAQISLSRQNLMNFSAQGAPPGGSFSYSAAKLSGTNIASVVRTPGVAATDNPNSGRLINPVNSDPRGVPRPGGLVQITAAYSTPNEGRAEKKFPVPTFGLSCYYTASEADWGAPPDRCKTTTIRGQRYEGIVKDPHGFKGTYCSAFIAQLRLQGSAHTRDNRIVQYDRIKERILVVKDIRGADGLPVVAGRTLARDRSIIPKKVLVDINRVGLGLEANDTGQAITGYRIDLYKGSGAKVCEKFENIISVAACSPGNATCPESSIP